MNTDVKPVISSQNGVTFGDPQVTSDLKIPTNGLRSLVGGNGFHVLPPINLKSLQDHQPKSNEENSLQHQVFSISNLPGSFSGKIAQRENQQKTIVNRIIVKKEEQGPPANISNDIGQTGAIRNQVTHTISISKPFEASKAINHSGEKAGLVNHVGQSVGNHIGQTGDTLCQNGVTTNIAGLTGNSIDHNRQTLHQSNQNELPTSISNHNGSTSNTVNHSGQVISINNHSEPPALVNNHPVHLTCIANNSNQPVKMTRTITPSGIANQLVLSTSLANHEMNTHQEVPTVSLSNQHLAAVISNLPINNKAHLNGAQFKVPQPMDVTSLGEFRSVIIIM